MVRTGHDPKLSASLLLAWILHGLVIAMFFALPSAQRIAGKEVQVSLVSEALQTLEQGRAVNKERLNQRSAMPANETPYRRPARVPERTTAQPKSTPATVPSMPSPEPAVTALPPAGGEHISVPAAAASKGSQPPVVDVRDGSSGAEAGRGHARGTGGQQDVEVGAGNGPRFVRKEPPIYPALAHRLGKQGKVVLRLTIDEKGHLQAVEVVERAGSGFDEAAVTAVRKSTFAPAISDGKPVASRALLTVTFRLQGR